VNEFLNLIRSFGVARLAAIVGVAFGVAVSLALITARIGAPPMGVLYANLSYSEAQAVIDRLERDSVDHRLRDEGARVTILAPRAKISHLRLGLAADGVNLGGGVGYEIFDNNQTLGATSFQQNMNRLRALEGELARTLAGINGVRAARVHLVLPERQLFARERQTASASIVVDAPSGLAPRAVRAIVNMTASAVPALDPARVTVLDSKGRLLASGADGETGDVLAASIEDKKVAAETRLRRAVEDMVGRIVGAENVRVEVAADMDFSRISESAEIIDPDSQTVLSSTTIEETSSSVDPSRSRGVSVANALPDAAASDDSDAQSTSSSLRTEETTNYEITKTVRNAVREEGLVIKRLSLAVALNGVVGAAEDGSPTYAPRSQEELARIETLVKSAIGFNPVRGDQVSVVDIRFAPAATPSLAAPAPTPVFDRETVMRIAEIGSLGLIALALVAFVLRPMLSPPRAGAAPPPAYLNENAPAAPAIAHEPESALAKRIDLSQIEGQVNASSIKKVSEVVKAHTDESANILRGWMRNAS